MAIADRVLALKLVTDVGNLGKDTKQVQGRFKSMAGSAKAWGKAMGGALVISGIAALPKMLGDLHADFKQGEDAARNLGRTYKNLGLDVESLGATVDKVAGLGLDMGFDDADTLAAFDKFVGLTGDSGKAMKLLSAAMDLSRARGWSLAKSVKFVSTHMDDLTQTTKENRGKAREWARNHPIEVATGKIVDNISTIVGALAKGDFGAAFEALFAIGGNLEDLLFGKERKPLDLHGIVKLPQGREGGLISRMEAVGGLLVGGVITGMGDLADRISEFWDTEIATVDWVAAIVKGLSDGFAALTTPEGIDVAQAGLVVGGALMAAIAGVDLIADALGAMFRAPGLLARKGLGVAVGFAGGIIGGALSIAVAAADLFADALGKMWRAPGLLTRKGLKDAIIWAGLVMGRALAIATAVGERFAGALSDMFYALPTLPGWTRTVAGLKSVGGKMGGIMGLAMAAGLAGDAVYNAASTAIGGLLSRLGVPQDAIDFATKHNRPWWGVLIDELFKFAGGTDSAPGGWSVVGEGGPELLHLPAGSRVLSNRDTQGALGGSSMTVNISMGVGDPVAVGREVERVLRAYRRRAGIPIAGAAGTS